MNEIIKELELSNIETICSRCEDYTKINREKYDVVVARAVSHLKILSELIIPTVKVNGYFVAMKSNVQDEIEISKNILSKLDSTVEKVIEFNLPIENSIRTLVKIKKNKITNVKYPRKYDQIKKSHCKK